MNKSTFSKLRSIRSNHAMSELHPRWVEFREALERLTKEESLTEEERLYVAFSYAEQSK